MGFKLIVNLMVYLLCVNSVFAAATPSDYFVGTLGTQKTVTVNPSGVTTSTITPSTGNLVTTLTPSFYMTTNSNSSQSLTFSATTNTQTTTENAIFNVSTNKYIILTNSLNLPPVSSITDIKSGSPNPTNNPNAIAYPINDPATATGLTVNYNSTNKNWDLVLSKKGQTATSATIPSGSPLANTYNYTDSAGPYYATIILTFN